ncbi:MAG: hypothetical protein EON58_20420 [Alphaproteobacteria bacterium]|nr:MAG: hypothetical protein EON58_20420 [Alphaproteobacteria bacterium]
MAQDLGGEAVKLPIFRSEQRAISDVTRKEVFDLLRLSETRFHGSRPEIDFLDQIYNLDELPSTDGRLAYNTARKDIFQHTVNNEDWDVDWVFTDSRFQLKNGPDEILLRFLAETLHPLVRDYSDAEELAKQYNALLRMDGWQLLPVREISGRPVYGPVPFAADGALVFGSARSIQQKLDSAYLGTQITRLQQAVLNDPELAIGTAKEFLESVVKTVLQTKGEAWNPSDSFPSLVKQALKVVKVVPDGISRQQETEQAVRVLVNNLGSSVDKLAEIRNWHGSGHGKDAKPVAGEVWLAEHHARFAVGVSIQIAQFIFDCLQAEGARPLDVVPANAQFQSDSADEYDPFADE